MEERNGLEWGVIDCRSYFGHFIDVAESGFARRPARALEGDRQLVPPPLGVVYVVEHGDPAVELQVEDVVAFDRLHQSIDHWLGWVFRLEGAEQFVPTDEEGAIVLVDVLSVARCHREQSGSTIRFVQVTPPYTVVDSVMRRTVDEPLERAERLDRFRVYPHHVQFGELEMDQEDLRRDSEQRQRDICELGEMDMVGITSGDDGYRH